jgi:diguanylate cyclase (GGDEF)-like protein
MIRVFGFAVTLIVFALAGALTAARNYSRDEHWVNHSDQVRLALSELFSSLRAAEMWHRGFLISGVVEPAAPFHAAVESSRRGIAQLRNLTADQSEQQRRLHGISKVAEREIARMENAHRALASGDYGIAVGTLDDGKRDVDTLRLLLGDMAAVEEALLGERSEQAAASLHLMLTGAAVTGCLALMLIAWAGIKLGSVAAAQHAHIGRLAESEASYRSESLLDEMTGVLNRRGLTSAGPDLQKRCGTVTLLFADLDGLKPINDQLGHEMGDQAIKEAAALLRDCVRDGDLVARVGGDELVCLLGGSCVDPVLERIDRALEQTNARLGRRFPLRMSLGAAVSKENESLESLLARADAVMYRVKLSRKTSRAA